MEQRRSQLAKVARLYWLEEVPQRVIAAKLNVSVASVSRMLNRARELGIVRIEIAQEESELEEIEIELERRFALRECLAAPTGETEAQAYAQMAHRLAELLGRRLKAGLTIGVSWGETLKRVGEEMPPVEGREVRVVPTIGAMGRIETGIYPNSIARSFAGKLGGEHYLVNTPAVLDSAELRESVVADSNFTAVAELWSGLDIAIFSVSGLGTDTSVYAAGIFSEAELRRARERGAVAAVNFAFISGEGREVDTDLAPRIVNLPLAELRRVGHRILVARGRNKVEPILAALRGGLCDTLVSDADTVRAVAEG